MASAYITNGKQFYWNIDANVGLSSPNRRDDVDLVQLGFFAMSKSIALPAEKRRLYSQVVPGARFSGREDDPLMKSIRDLEVFANPGFKDGHISVITGGAPNFVNRANEAHQFKLIIIGRSLFELDKLNYPRIDRLVACPPALKASVLRYFQNL